MYVTPGWRFATIATINGHQATRTVGTTEFYALPTTNTIASVTPAVSQGLYEKNEANLNIVITPMVSGDEQVTLSISVKQSTLGDAIGPTAPSNQFTQNFESLIRVKNNDMVILGGLENQRKSNSTTGLPGLAKVPILKWFFSERSNVDTDSKLSIFIKLTIIY